MGNIKPIKFGPRSFYWTDDVDHNKSFIDSNKKYLEAIYDTKGYIYLSEIYDSFGVAWDPEDENICWNNKQFDKMAFVVAHQAGDPNWYIYPKKN